LVVMLTETISSVVTDVHNWHGRPVDSGLSFCRLEDVSVSPFTVDLRLGAIFWVDLCRRSKVMVYLELLVYGEGEISIWYDWLVEGGRTATIKICLRG